MTDAKRWSAPVIVAQIPENGLRLELDADEATREALAALGGLRALPRAQASVELSHAGSGKVQVRGRVRATAGQTCVVTLEPIESEIDETFDVLFVPEGEVPPLPKDDSEGDDTDAPEAIVNGVIDVGGLAADYLFLGIDPYPRKPGAVFAPVIATPDPEDHPFAALKALQQPSGPDRQVHKAVGGEDASSSGEQPEGSRGPGKRP